MSDFHTEALLERDARAAGARDRCCNCGGERPELEDGWCSGCLREPGKRWLDPCLTTTIYSRLFGPDRPRRGDE